jgi:CesT_Tir_1
MKTAADVQAYLMKMELPSEEPRENTWMVSGLDGLDHLIITLAGPVLVFRVKVMDIPRHHREELFRTLLELNATEMMHGAYGIEGDSVVIMDALQLENLDYNEFAATVDDITLAVASHHGRLAKFREAA